jgi:hypothetical protein
VSNGQHDDEKIDRWVPINPFSWVKPMGVFVRSVIESVIHLSWQSDFSPLVLGLFAASISAYTSPRHATKDFYDIASQIIPLLIVAIALEARLLGTKFIDVVALETSISNQLTKIRQVIDESGLTADQEARLLKQQTDFSGLLDTLKQSRPGHRRYRWLVGIYVTMTVIILGYGEIYALNVVARGKYQTAYAPSVFGAIALGIVMIIAVALRSPRS